MLFLGSLYAGHRTRFLNLQRHTKDDPRIRPAYRGVSGWVAGGLIERLPGIPRGVRGRARKDRLDQAAACLILQELLDERKAAAGGVPA